MPFQSEKQRRYLWANEPEIARDWADTYGSRIESNTGGISRLGYAEGPKPIRPVPGGPVYRVNEEEEEEENPLQKFISMMQGNAGNLSQGDVTANTNFLRNNNVRFAQNNPYRMTSGPFQGMNAPGSSAFGSKNPKEMAQKWVKRYGDIEREKNSPMARKSQAMKNMATMNEAPPGRATGGIMRLGYARGNPHQDQDVQGPAHLSHNAPVDQGPTHLSHNAPSGGQGGGNNQGPGIGPTLDKGANIAQTFLPFLNPKNANILSMGLGLKGVFDTFKNRNKNLSQDDMIYGTDDQVSGPGNYSQNEVAGQLFGTSFGLLDSVQQGQVNDAIGAYGTTSIGTLRG